MKDPQECFEHATPVDGEVNHHDQDKGRDESGPTGPADSSRRSFCRVGGATAVALAAGIPLEPLFEGKHGQAEASVVSLRFFESRVRQLEVPR